MEKSSLVLLGFSVFGLISISKIINKILKTLKISKNQENIFDQMKNTPLIFIKSLSELTGCKIYGKCEYQLPFTSKDRMIKNIILEAEKEGKINKQTTTLYEGSSGSTGYSVASIARLLGYKSKIVIPDDLSDEKLSLLKSTGCEIIVTKQCPFSNFKNHYVRLAKKLSRKENGFYIDQFFNKINSETHYKETGPEIYRDLKGKIDLFVSSSGTGGTISGISRYLKEKNPKIKVILADNVGSGLHSYVKNGVMFTNEETEENRKKYRYYSIIEGIGGNFVTSNFESAIIDDSFKIMDDEAIFMANYIYEKDGIFVGGSSAVNLCAVVKAAKNEKKGSVIVTILFDSGLKYLSKIFQKDKQLNINSINEI